MVFNRLPGSRSPILKSALVLASLLPPLACVPAHADELDETSSLSVSTQGLDLSVPADAAQLRHRIEIAVRRVCGLLESSTLATQRVYRSCHDQAIADANAQMRVMVARTHDRTQFVSDTVGH